MTPLETSTLAAATSRRMTSRARRRARRSTSCRRTSETTGSGMDPTALRARWGATQ